jgi:hypothetical protein
MKTLEFKHLLVASFMWLTTLLPAISQLPLIKYDLYSLSETDKLEVFNRKVFSFSEKDIRGIRFSKNENDGVAWLKDVSFSDGTIEVDIRGKNEYQQSFVGIAFHGIDNNIFDAVYFRPFNFQTTDPVRKIHSVQYISQPDFTWQALREKFNGKYEKEIVPTPDGNNWFHVKIVIKYPRISVFVGDNLQPSLSVEQLNKRTDGKIGLWVGNNSDGDFANLQIVKQE